MYHSSHTNLAPIRNVTPYPTHVALTSNSPKDSAIVDAASNQTLYVVSTNGSLRHRTTTLSTSDGKVLAIWEMRRWVLG